MPFGRACVMSESGLQNSALARRPAGSWIWHQRYSKLLNLVVKEGNLCSLLC